MAYARPLVDKVVHREGRDANLGTSACACASTRVKSLSPLPPPLLQERGTGESRIGVHVHVAGLRDKAEDAAVLLAEGSNVHGNSAARGGELAGERLLRDLWQVAKAIIADP